MMSFYTLKTTLDPETRQASYIKPEEGLRFDFG